MTQTPVTTSEREHQRAAFLARAGLATAPLEALPADASTRRYFRLGGEGLLPQQLAGWVGLAGPYDFLPIGVPDVQRAFDWPRTPADSQPLFQVTSQPFASAPPALLLEKAARQALF